MQHHQYMERVSGLETHVGVAEVAFEKELAAFPLPYTPQRTPGYPQVRLTRVVRAATLSKRLPKSREPCGR